MAKRFFRTAFFCALICIIAACAASCSSQTFQKTYNKLDMTDSAIRAEYSRDFVAWSTVEADTKLFTTDIFAPEAHETIYVRLTNTAEDPIRIDLGIYSAYDLEVPSSLCFYTEFFVNAPISIPNFSKSLVIGKDHSEARMLAPNETICAALSVFCNDEKHSAVSPLLGFALRAESAPYGFDPASPDAYLMKEGQDLFEILPRDITAFRTDDCAAPKDTLLDDLSFAQNGAVLGWREGDTYIVSTQKTGQKAILHPMSARFFAGCEKLCEVDLSLLDTSRVQDMMRFFSSCESLVSLDLSHFDTANVIRTRSMFNGCTSLVSLSIENWDTSSMKDTSYMFASTPALKHLDLSAWDLSQTLYNTAMFQSAGVETLLLPNNLTVMDNLFLNHAKNVKTDVFELPPALMRAGLAHFLYNFGTSALVAYRANENNDAVKVIDGILYSKDGTKLLAIPKGKTFENGIYAIPEGVTFLGELCFSRNPHVKTVLLPNSYRMTVYHEQNHPDFCDPNGTGNLNVGNSLNIATYIYSGVCAYAVKDDNPVYCAENGVLYTKENGKAASLIAVPVGFAGDMVIADSVTSWQADALWEDSGVKYTAWTSLYIPAALQEIAASQIDKINSLSLKVTVSPDNPVYTVDADGKLCAK